MRLPILFLLSSSLISAYPSVIWLTKSYDFGLMKEAAGPKTGTAAFTNSGNEPITILEVKPSCGCTSTEYSEEPVMPGDTATISFTYDPYRRPGRFEKSVRVRLSDGTTHRIPISGNVLGTPESVDMLYPGNAGDIRLSETSLHLGDIKMGRTSNRFINAYNLSTDTVSPSVTTSSPLLRTQASSRNAGPGDLITYSILLDTSKSDTLSYGPASFKVAFASSPGAEPLTVPVTAYIIPDAQMLAARQGDRHPAIDIDAGLIDLGDINTGSTCTREITIKNSGKAPLTLFRIFTDPKSGVKPADAGNSLPDIPVFTLKPGKSRKITISIPPLSLSAGPHRFNLVIMSDDPLRTITTLPVALNIRTNSLP